MKNNLSIIFFFLIVLSSCQREKLNELGIEFNKSLLVPPKYDLPEPGSISKMDEEDPDIIDNSKISDSSISLVGDILEQTNSYKVDSSIRNEIDFDSGINNEEGFFENLLKPAHEREKEKQLSDTIDPFEEKEKISND